MNKILKLSLILITSISALSLFSIFVILPKLSPLNKIDCDKLFDAKLLNTYLNPTIDYDESSTNFHSSILPYKKDQACYKRVRMSNSYNNFFVYNDFEAGVFYNPIIDAKYESLSDIQAENNNSTDSDNFPILYQTKEELLKGDQSEINYYKKITDSMYLKIYVDTFLLIKNGYGLKDYKIEDYQEEILSNLRNISKQIIIQNSLD